MEALASYLPAMSCAPQPRDAELPPPGSGLAGTRLGTGAQDGKRQIRRVLPGSVLPDGQLHHEIACDSEQEMVEGLSVVMPALEELQS